MDGESRGSQALGEAGGILRVAGEWGAEGCGGQKGRGAEGDNSWVRRKSAAQLERGEKRVSEVLFLAKS